MSVKKKGYIATKATKEFIDKVVKETPTDVERCIVQESVISKPIYKFGFLGYILAKVLIQSSRWFADQVFGKFADWVELKLKK